jgi:opacity protein-like surface antigen
MNVFTACAIPLVLLALSAPARAQSWELSGLGAYTPSVAIDRQAPEVTGLDMRGGFTWGIQGARSITPRWDAEVLWMQQSSALKIGTAAGTADLFSTTIRQVHGNAVRNFGTADARMRLFAFAGLGATFFSADDLRTETKLSFGLGGGVKYFPWRSIGIRAHFRYKPTVLKDKDSGDFCDPFGFCQGSLQQVEFAGGAVVRF